MKAEELALVQGWDDTCAALRRWQAAPRRIAVPWAAGSAAVAVALLLATWMVALVVAPDPTGLDFPGVTRPAHLGDFGFVLFRNGLVLALHAMACVAGFIAGSSLPLQARQHRGLARLIHERGARLAIVFVVAATMFSLSAQALVLGISVGHVAYGLHTSPGLLLVALLPHAIPELTALFLPLAAWIMASRRGEWDKLLAATFVTVALAIPVLVMSALWEVYIAPHVLSALIS